MKKPFGAKKDDSVNIELRDSTDQRPGRLILATVEGGIEKCSVIRRGNTTTIKLTSPKGLVVSDGWERPKREERRRSAPKPQAAPR